MIIKSILSLSCFVSPTPLCVCVCMCVSMFACMDLPLASPSSSVALFRTVCTVPLIDSINGKTYNIEPQGGGDEDGFARGAWDWSMLWKRVPLGSKEKQMRLTRTEPYR